MKNILLILFFGLSLLACTRTSMNKTKEITKTSLMINSLLDKWHKDAAEAKLEDYIDLLAEDAHYIGTDASENWTRDSFFTFCKPYFDKGTTWNFTVVERNTFIKNDMAWFDEILNTQMGLCRGSGVLIQQNGEWKLSQYVLSMAVPNDVSKEVTGIKKNWDEQFLSKVQGEP